MITYTIKENNEDIKKATIVKTGHEIEFTLEQMEENEALLEKQKKEIEGVVQNRFGIMSNIEDNHAFVKELSDKERFTVHMYEEAKNEYKKYNEALSRVNEMLDKSAKEKAEIKSQLNIVDNKEVVEEVKETETNG